MVIIDTCVWVDHFRRSVDGVDRLVLHLQAATHPFVIGELYCGGIRRRETVLASLYDLPLAPVAEHHEVLEMVRLRQLHGRGLSFIDAHLLAAALLGEHSIMTRDKALASAATQLGVLWSP
ncbi:MAG: PIN domain-containing protein [Phycisphaerales bacterium]|nr:PIN domain-containing protein [Phycisphaerales bacterium]